MRQSQFVLVLYVLFGVLIHGCRTNDGNFSLVQNTSIDDDLPPSTDHQPNTSSGSASDQPNTPPFVNNDAVQNTMPSEENLKDYVTDIVVTAGCTSNPPSMAVARQHQSIALCEHLIMIAARNDDGDFYEVGAPFNWSIDDPSVIELSFLFGPADNYAQPVGKLDVFDGDGVTEPRSTVMACALNTCPVPRPADCLNMVCTSLDVLSVVNLHAVWEFTGDAFDGGATIVLEQDGRSVRDKLIGLDGQVDGALVNLAYDGKLYTGTIAPDRAHLNGQVFDAITLEPLGNWQALRVGL